MQRFAPFHEAKNLGYLIEHLDGLPKHSWLYIASSEVAISLDTLCFSTTTDARDMSDEEYQAFEDEVIEAGLKCFFSKDQLEDVVANYRAQSQFLTQDGLLAAIEHYWKNDAFIQLPQG